MPGIGPPTAKACRPLAEDKDRTIFHGLWAEKVKNFKVSTDYETYKEIMGELLSPIMAEGLDPDTLKRLYESKAVYLENLRIKCFRELNMENSTFFSQEDYQLILEAISRTRGQLRKLIIVTLQSQLDRRKVS